MRTRRVGFAFLFLLVAGVTQAFAQTRAVTGTVTHSATGAPVDQARVSVRGTPIVVLTRADGTFSIGVPAGAVELLVRRIGYSRVTVNVSANESVVNVALDADVFNLDEVVVTGRGTGIERRNLANAVATLEGDVITQVTAQSIEHALQGKIAGADIQTNSGAPGGGAQVRLRGVTTISASASPLYVVDGVIISNVAVASNQNAVTRAGSGSNASSAQDAQVNRIVDINPNDIQTIEVLKGASASAIYGSKASNGVIIITTKRGREGRPQVNVTQRFGFFDLSNKLGFRTFEDAAEVDAAFGAGTATSVGYTPGVTFDHEQALAGRNALSAETQLSVSGGSENTSYFVSGVWKQDEGIIENTGFDRQGVRINLDQRFSDRFRGTFSTNFMHTLARRGLSNNDNAGVSPWMVFPFTPNIVDLSRRADGTFPDNPFERSNPLATLASMRNDEDVYRFIGSGRLELDLVQNASHRLQLLGQGGVDWFQQQNDLFFPAELQFEDDDGFPGTSLLTNTDNLNINVNANIIHTYTSRGGMTFTSSAGLTYETRNLESSSIQAQAQVAGQENINAGTKFTLNEIRTRSEDFGFYVQEEVLLMDERLLLTAGLRGDQTSRNSEDDKVFYYPKAAASFRFPGTGGFFDELKFRAAYGETGNQPLFGQKFTPLSVTQNVEGIPGLIVQGRVGSCDLKPERQKEIEGGFDATMASGRASLEFTLFQKSVSDLIISRTLASSSGFANQVFNGAKLRTRGAEVALGIVPIDNANINWFFRTTFALTRSVVTELSVPAFIPANAGFGVGLGTFRIEEGKSVTQLVGNLADGSGVGQIGDATPDFKMGFTNDVQIGNFSLYAHANWQKGGDLVNLTELLFDAGQNSEDFEDAGSNRISNFGGDTKLYVQDGSFLKIREVTLAWQLPRNLTESLWGAIQDARLSLSGRNLINISGYRGLDSEVSNFGNQSVGRNIDVAPFPPSRSFWFSIDLSF